MDSVEQTSETELGIMYRYYNYDEAYKIMSGIISLNLAINGDF